MAQQYLRQQIEQAGPIEQVLMLYDGAIRFIMKAREAIVQNDIQVRCDANRRAMEILAYLIDMVSPNMADEAGKRLFGIYSGLLKRMLQIDFENSTAVCDELIENIRTLRVATAQAVAAQKSANIPSTGTVVAAPTQPENVPEGLLRNAVA